MMRNLSPSKTQYSSYLCRVSGVASFDSLMCRLYNLQVIVRTPSDRQRMQDADACRPASHQATTGDLVVPEWGSAEKQKPS